MAVPAPLRGPPSRRCNYTWRLSEHRVHARQGRVFRILEPTDHTDVGVFRVGVQIGFPEEGDGRTPVLNTHGPV